MEAKYLSLEYRKVSKRLGFHSECPSSYNKQACRPMTKGRSFAKQHKIILKLKPHKPPLETFLPYSPSILCTVLTSKVS